MRPQISAASLLLATVCVWSLLTTATQAQDRNLEVTAVAGEPFGVGVVTLAMGEQPLGAEPDENRRGIRGRILGRDGAAIRRGIFRIRNLIEPQIRLIGDQEEQEDSEGRGAILPVEVDEPAADSTIYLDDAEGRVLYPAQARPGRRGVRGLIRGMLDRDGAAPAATTLFFLFRGDEPFNLKLYLPEALEVQVTPRSDAPLHRELLSRWWESYQNDSGLALLRSEPEYPRVVENFLKFTLARRLNLPAPRQQRPAIQAVGRLLGQPEIGSAYAPLSGTDALKERFQREILLTDAAEAPADRPLPQLPPAPAVDWKSLLVEPLPVINGIPAGNGDVPVAPQNDAEAAGSLPTSAAVEPEVVIEEMANYVPEECFYLRFGSFDNFWWLKTLTDRAEGDLGALFITSAVKYEISQRMQDRLEIRDVLLADLLGPLVIADAAVIGTDTFLREGASIGFVIRAQNTNVLGTLLQGHRRMAVRNYPDAVLEDVQIAGNTVSFLHTPDNRVRSFYASVGDYHCVTTSRTLMRRFFEASSGKGSLGQSAEFRVARRRIPVDRHDTMFVYASDAFFENLATPHYRIEMVRRLKAHARLEAAMLAQLAAKAEGAPHETVENLIEAGLLPRGFNQTTDGSRIQFVDGKPVDTLRGGLGSLKPVADMEIDRVSAREVTQYREFAASYRSDWGRMPPVVIGLRRDVEDGGVKDRVRIDLAVAPITRTPRIMQWMRLITGDGPLELRLPGNGQAPAFALGGEDEAGDTRPRENHIQFESLEDSSLALLLDPLARRSARRNLHGSLIFLNSLQQQLRVPAKDCMDVANTVLNGKLVSTIGGDFVLDEQRDYPVWTHRPNGERAGQHAFRPLNWCRSLDARWVAGDTQLTAHIDTLLELPPMKGAFGLKLKY